MEVNKNLIIRDSAVGDPIALTPGEMQVRITRKLAGALNGLDLKPFDVGEVVNLDDSFARMLIAEGWAEAHHPAATADDRAPRRRKRDKQLLMPPEGDKPSTT